LVRVFPSTGRTLSFVSEIANPSADERRITHLERSDKAYERFYSPEPISELPADE